MSFHSIVTLNNGVKMPQIGLGTWLSKPHEVEKAVEFALKHGYRHLDLAKVYQNQDEVAKGIKASGVPRSEIFITGKLWNTWHQPANVLPGLEDSLKELQLDYLDLFLIHWPVAFVPGNGKFELFPKHPTKENEVALDLDTSLVDTWKAMIKLQETGKVKAIGVSNCTVEALEALISATGVTPAVNQIERHPLLQQKELVDFCAKKNIHLTAYSPLGNNLSGQMKIVEYPEVIEIAKKKGVDPAQVLIAWGKVGGHSVIPKSITPSRIESNFAEVKLTDEEFATISALGDKKTTRFNIPLTYSPKWDIDVFGEEAEASSTHKAKLQ